MFHVKHGKEGNYERDNSDYIYFTSYSAINHSTAYTLSIRFLVSRET